MTWIAELTFLDWIAIVLLALPAAMGIFKGFFRTVFRFVGILLGFGFGIVFSRALGNQVKILFNLDSYFWSRLMVFIAIFALGWFIGLVLGMIVKKILRAIKMGWIDRSLGFLLGLVEGGAVVSVICIVLALIPPGEAVIKDSRIVLPMVRSTVYAANRLPKPWTAYLDPHRWIGDHKEKAVQFYKQSIQAPKTKNTSP
ncbi:CvpA family protein [bacterium]|nr:CvpA family protein [candidate division CSSED10-310 bacterium]